MTRKQKQLLILTSVLIILLLLVIPFRIPCSISTTGKILPAREYLVMRDRDSGITTRLINHTAGVTEQAGVIQPQRGDAQQFKMYPRVLSNPNIACGDTLAMISSPDLDHAVIRLQALLRQAEATLIYYATGEKPAYLQEAEQQVTAARIQAEEQQRVVERLRELLNNNLISRQEYDLALAGQRVFEVNIAIAEARLTGLQTGAKPEQMALLRTQIAGLEREIDILEKKAASYVLRSPIGGVRLLQSASDTLLTIASQDTFIVAMLVSYRDRWMLKPGLDVEISAPDGRAVTTVIEQIYQSGATMNGEQLFWVTAKLLPLSDLYSGLYVKCRIRPPHLSKRRFIDRLIR